jgi:hypothetical protein
VKSPHAVRRGLINANGSKPQVICTFKMKANQSISMFREGKAQKA